jgi:UDP:flavonoid glycosyltransferase YjiC (YdhE family)
MTAVAKQCDLAIHHAPHGTTAAMMLAGIPSLLLPIYLEQGLMGHALCRLGAAEQIPVTHPDAAIAALQKLLESDRYTTAAQRFAQKYADYDPRLANEHLLDDIEDLLNAGIPLTESKHHANIPRVEMDHPTFEDAPLARSI